MHSASCLINLALRDADKLHQSANILDSAGYKLALNGQVY